MPLSGRKSWVSSKAFLLTWAPAWLAAPRAIVSVMSAALRAAPRRRTRPVSAAALPGNGDPARGRDGLAVHATPPVPDWAHDRSRRPAPRCGHRTPRSPRAARRRRAVAAQPGLRHGARGGLGSARGPRPRERDARLLDVAARGRPGRRPVDGNAVRACRDGRVPSAANRRRPPAPGERAAGLDRCRPRPGDRVRGRSLARGAGPPRPASAPGRAHRRRLDRALPRDSPRGARHSASGDPGPLQRGLISPERARTDVQVVPARPGEAPDRDFRRGSWY